LNDGRENPDTVNSILEYQGGWNLTFESTVLPVKAQSPEVLFLGTEGSLDISRARYVFMPNKGRVSRRSGAGIGALLPRRNWELIDSAR
jgi:hypothetical protein